MEMSARAEIMQEKMAQNSQNPNNNNETSAGNSTVNSNVNSAENSTGNSNTNSTENSAGNSRIPSINHSSSTGGYYAAISDLSISSQIASNNQKSVIDADVDLAALIG